MKTITIDYNNDEIVLGNYDYPYPAHGDSSKPIRIHFRDLRNKQLASLEELLTYLAVKDVTVEEATEDHRGVALEF